MSDCPHTWWIPADCPDCKGSGKFTILINGYYPAYVGKQDCPACKGTGKKEGFEECERCHIVTIATQETEK